MLFSARSHAFNLVLRPGGHSVPLATQNWTACVPRIANGRTGHWESCFGACEAIVSAQGFELLSVGK